MTLNVNVVHVLYRITKQHASMAVWKRGALHTKHPKPHIPRRTPQAINPKRNDPNDEKHRTRSPKRIRPNVTTNEKRRHHAEQHKWNLCTDRQKTADAKRQVLSEQFKWKVRSMITPMTSKALPSIGARNAQNERYRTYDRKVVHILKTHSSSPWGISSSCFPIVKHKP